MGAVSYASVSVGDERQESFPALTRTMFVRYAGASGDFNPMHHDDTIATQVGNPSVFTNQNGDQAITGAATAAVA